MRADELLPDADVGDCLARTTGLPPARIYAALTAWSPGDRPLWAALLRLRDLPARLAGGRGGMRRLAAGPLPPIAAAPPRWLAVGLAARPWHPDVALEVLDAAGFAAFDRAGYCKVLWHFALTPRDPGTTLVMTTRVAALGGPAVRRRLARYWRLGHRPSAWVRGAWLADVVRAAG